MKLKPAEDPVLIPCTQRPCHEPIFRIVTCWTVTARVCGKMVFSSKWSDRSKHSLLSVIWLHSLQPPSFFSDLKAWALLYSSFWNKNWAGERSGKVPVTANVREMLSLLHKSFRESVYLSELVLCTRDVVASALLRYEKAPARTFFSVQKEKIGKVGSVGEKKMAICGLRTSCGRHLRQGNIMNTVQLWREGAVLPLCSSFAVCQLWLQNWVLPKTQCFKIAIQPLMEKTSNIRVNCFALCI